MGPNVKKDTAGEYWVEHSCNSRWNEHVFEDEKITAYGVKSCRYCFWDSDVN